MRRGEERKGEEPSDARSGGPGGRIGLERKGEAEGCAKILIQRQWMMSVFFYLFFAVF